MYSSTKLTQEYHLLNTLHKRGCRVTVYRSVVEHLAAKSHNDDARHACGNKATTTSSTPNPLE